MRTRADIYERQRAIVADATLTGARRQAAWADGRWRDEDLEVILDRWARGRPDHTALVDGAGRLTYQALAILVGEALMDLNLGGKSVIVTGGGSNIGRAIGLAFAREGVHLTIAEIDEVQGARVAAEARKQGAATATVVPTDVTRWDSVQAMVQEVEGRLGGVDVLVNNVGWVHDRLFIEKERAEWEKEIQLNLWGMINCTRAVLDGMIARKSGAIVSMGSEAGRMGEFREGVYAACKAGIMALSKSIAREVGRHGIRLNVVCPGMTMPASDDEIGPLSMWTTEANRAWNTPEMHARMAKAYPLRRIGKAEDVAPAVVFLASDAAGFITGQILSVSGGYTMM